MLVWRRKSREGATYRLISCCLHCGERRLTRALLYMGFVGEYIKELQGRQRISWSTCPATKASWKHKGIDEYRQCPRHSMKSGIFGQSTMNTVHSPPRTKHYHVKSFSPCKVPPFWGVSGVSPILSSPKPLVTFCCSKKSLFLFLPPFIQSHSRPHLQSPCPKKFVSSRLDRCKWWVEDGLFAWACKEVFFFFFFSFFFFLAVIMVIMVVVIGFGVHD